MKDKTPREILSSLYNGETLKTTDSRFDVSIVQNRDKWDVRILNNSHNEGIYSPCKTKEDATVNALLTLGVLNPDEKGNDTCCKEDLAISRFYRLLSMSHLSLPI